MEILQKLSKTENKSIVSHPIKGFGSLKGKHVTLIGLNFHPESTAIGLYSTQLADYLLEQGAILDVITAFPYYPQWKIAEEYKGKGSFLKEDYHGMTLRRYKQYTPAKPTFLKRIIHIIDFTFGSFINLLKIKKCDYVISVVPFTSSAFLGYVQKKRFKAKYWIHIQDFEFDAAFQSGLVQTKNEKKGFVYRSLMRLEKWLFSKADTVSTISHMMMAKLTEKTTSSTYFLPNWIDQETIDPDKSKPHTYLTSPKFKIVYSGSIGDKQDWVFFMELVSKLDFNRFEIIIVGDGAQRKQLETEIKDHPGITLYPPVPYEELSDLLCSADVHFLFQKTEVLDTVMPSKILGMMASAKPSVITGHSDSEVAKVMQESEGGFYVSDKKVETILTLLENMYQNPQEAREMGIKARNYVVQNFAIDPILQGFVGELSQL